MNENDLRDCFAMFAMTGIIMTGFDDVVEEVANNAYKMADAMLEARKAKDETGIVAVKPRRRKS